MTLPKRSTLATASLELVHRQATSPEGRIVPSLCIACALCASVTPVYSVPGSGTITTFVTAGQVTVTGTVMVTVRTLVSAGTVERTISYLPALSPLTHSRVSWIPPRAPLPRIEGFSTTRPCAS